MAEENAELWVQQLYDPSTRRTARRNLIATRAVQPLLECLNSPNESVLWSAVQSLGELRAKEAVEPLVGLLDRGVLILDVCEALTLITGKDFGADATRWKKALGEPGKLTEGLDVVECVRKTSELIGVRPAGSGENYTFKLATPGGRFQKVAVFFGKADSDGDELVVIYSECGPANPKYYEALLRKNMTIPAGAFAIRDVGGQAQIVMVETMLAASVTPSTLAKRIEHIASRADSVEKSLTNEDRR